MKSIFVLASLAACAVAQRLHIQAPTSSQNVPTGSALTVELEQDQSLGPLRPGTVVISLNSCYDVCDQPSQWGPASIVYNGAFNPQFNASAPQKGHYQDFVIQLPQLQPGGAVIQVAHQFQEGGAELQDVFDYSYVQFNIQ